MKQEKSKGLSAYEFMEKFALKKKGCEPDFVFSSCFLSCFFVFFRHSISF